VTVVLPTAAALRLNAGRAGISLRRNGATASLVVTALVYYGVRVFTVGADCGWRRVPRLLGAARRKRYRVFR